MFRCPHCNEKAVSLWQKVSGGLGGVAVCTACGQESGIRLSLAVLALFAGVVLVLVIGSAILMPHLPKRVVKLVDVCVLAVLIAAYSWWAPLVKRGQ